MRNASDADFESVTVGLAREHRSYGALRRGETSDYQTVAAAYRYAYIEVRIDGKPYVLQPIDYVGESLLPPGRYTYELRLRPSDTPPSLGEEAVYGLLELKLRRDRSGLPTRSTATRSTART